MTDDGYASFRLVIAGDRRRVKLQATSKDDAIAEAERVRRRRVFSTGDPNVTVGDMFDRLLERRRADVAARERSRRAVPREGWNAVADGCGSTVGGRSIGRRER